MNKILHYLICNLLCLDALIKYQNKLIYKYEAQELF